jgi:hypothetical protein
MRRVLAVACFVLVLGLVHASASWGCAFGGLYPLAAVDGAGEMLVAWQETTSGAPEEDGEEVCGSEVTPVAVGSPATGFEDLGPLTGPGGMSRPTGVVLDEAGDGWVIGVHNGMIGATRYGGIWQWTSAWVAFRPAGGRFQPAVKLPSKGLLEEPPMVAGNKAGVTLFAWSTDRGTYLAWGDPDGKVTAPRFFGRSLNVTGIGVNEQGEAFVVGYDVSRPPSHKAKSIVFITGRAYGAFSPPRVIAAEPRNHRGQVTTEFGRPLAAVGPTGAAVIIWETWRQFPRHPQRNSPGPSLLVYREADGHVTSPRRIQKKFLSLNLGPTFATVDAAGRALLVHKVGTFTWREVVVMPGGQLGPERLVPEGLGEPSLAGNEGGETVIGMVAKRKSLLFLVGDTSGVLPVSETFATPYETTAEPIVTIDGRGEATAVWIEMPQKKVSVVDARALAPGAQTVQIARTEPTP